MIRPERRGLSFWGITVFIITPITCAVVGTIVILEKLFGEPVILTVAVLALCFSLLGVLFSSLS